MSNLNNTPGLVSPRPGVTCVKNNDGTVTVYVTNSHGDDAPVFAAAWINGGKVERVAEPQLVTPFTIAYTYKDATDEAHDASPDASRDAGTSRDAHIA